MVVSSTDASVVKLGDHLDVRNVGLARETLHGVLEHASGEVVLDLGGLESIDAAGLGMLTALHLRCERLGLRLVLRDCPREIRRVLTVTRLNRLLHVERPTSPMSA
jgi:anti-sigma B factor antagonist